MRWSFPWKDVMEGVSSVSGEAVSFPPQDSCLLRAVNILRFLVTCLFVLYFKNEKKYDAGKGTTICIALLQHQWQDVSQL